MSKEKKPQKPRLTDNISFIHEKKKQLGDENSLTNDEITLSFLKEVNELAESYDVKGMILIASYSPPSEDKDYTFSVISYSNPTEMIGILETLKQQIWADHYLLDGE